MKAAIVLLVFLSLLGGGYRTAIAAPAEVAWRTDLPGAKAASLKAGKPILLVFSATWCGPCKAMERDTYPNPGVQAVISKMVCVHLDIDKNVAEAQAFQVNSIPRILLLPAGGGPPLMDSTGYQGPEDFLSSLGDALHIKIAGGATVLPTEKPELLAVKQALNSKTFGKLKQKDAHAAKAGLNMLVEQLGVFDEPQVTPIIDLLGNAGDDAVPALITGMGSKTLAVRAGSYRALQAILSTRKIALPAQYDPWEKSAARAARVSKFASWWGARNLSAHHSGG